MYVRCYAEGREGQWEALCLDFDIAVQGTSFRQVHEELLAAIQEYLAYVRDLPAEERAPFLGRRAPMTIRLKFLWHAVLSLFRHWRGEGPDRAEFTISYPA